MANLTVDNNNRHSDKKWFNFRTSINSQEQTVFHAKLTQLRGVHFLIGFGKSSSSTYVAQLLLDKRAPPFRPESVNQDRQVYDPLNYWQNVTVVSG